MIVLGLTGSIGMGKSTTAALFRGAGVNVFDADRCVHRLYGNQAFAAVKARFPDAIRDENIDRKELSRLVLNDPVAMADLEGIIHPLVSAARARFLKRERENGAPIAVIDLPLLFETGAWRDVDAVAVVSAPAEIQLKRVLARPGMDAAKFSALAKRQVPDQKKRHFAHFVVRSEFGLESAKRQVEMIVCALYQAA